MMGEKPIEIKLTDVVPGQPVPEINEEFICIKTTETKHKIEVFMMPKSSWEALNKI